MTELICHRNVEVPREWVPRPDGLEKSFLFRPGHNCQDLTMTGHGVHGMELEWSLRGPLGAVTVTFSTDWVPGELFPGHGIAPDGTRGYLMFNGRWSSDPGGRTLEYHYRRPVEDLRTSDSCELLGEPCSWAHTYVGADDLVPLFMSGGDKPVWEALERAYNLLEL